MKKKVNNISKTLKHKDVILFDGYCNLCSWSVQFIIKRDKNDYFRFASLQSTVSSQLLNQFDLPDNFDQSVVLIEDTSIYFKSDAALRIAKKLRHLWPLLYLFRIVPRPLRDNMYSFIANHRFKWFGKKDSCYMPNEDLSYKFLV